jgi:hypothetical protein
MKTNLKTEIGIGFSTLLISFFVLFIIAQNTSGQKKGDPGKKEGNQPKEDVKVNKQFDKDGNMIAYDSTYSWSWSNNENMPENIDSIFKSFHNRDFNFSIFNDSLFFSMPLGFKSELLNDSLWNRDIFKNFFNEDFGNMDKFFEQHNKLIEKYFRHDPYLKIPDNSKVTPPPAEKDEKIKPREDNKIKTEKISGTTGVII